jgi:hypothetical protein
MFAVLMNASIISQLPRGRTLLDAARRCFP